MYKYILPIAALLMGCSRQIDFYVDITIIDTGSSGGYYYPDQPSSEPSGGGEPSGNREPAGEPAGEPSGDPGGGGDPGDPGDPGGGNQGGGNQGGDPNDTANPGGGDPGGGGGDPGGGGGGGDPGAFDSCDAYGYCTFGEGFDMSLVMDCQSGSSNSDYSDWFTCMADRGDPCSGAGGGNWSGCDCDVIAQCEIDYTDPFE